MSKNKFKLQKLLDIRVKSEEESKVKYTKAQHKKKVIEDNLNNLQMNYKKYSDITNVDDRVTQMITMNYLTSVSQSIRETTTQLKKEEINVNKAKDDFIQRQIQRKSLETLKENEINKLMKEEERVEQIINDEFALYAYIRNRVNAS